MALQDTLLTRRTVLQAMLAQRPFPSLLPGRTAHMRKDHIS